MVTQHNAEQRLSRGDSTDEIREAALRASLPVPGLSWLDVGCGSGRLLAQVDRECAPSDLTGVDIIDYISDELRARIALRVGPSEETLASVAAADRVMLLEVLEHVDAPWTLLRQSAGLVRPGGRLVATTPNVASLRHRLELTARGQLTAFRPDNQPHFTPILPHVMERVLVSEGLEVERVYYSGRDVIPRSGGRRWGQRAFDRFPMLAGISVGVVARRTS